MASSSAETEVEEGLLRVQGRGRYEIVILERNQTRTM